MWNNQVVWQLTDEPRIEPIVRAAAALVVIATSAYLTARVFRTLGFTSGKTDTLLSDLHDAVERSDLPTVSRLAQAFPKNSPEAGLSKLASLSDVQQSRDVPKTLKEADFVFHTVMQKLCLYREALHGLVYVTGIGSCLWFIMQLWGIASGISSQTHFNTSVVAASLSEVMGGTAELLAVVAAVCVFERVCAFRISKRTDRWRLFLSSSSALPADPGEALRLAGSPESGRLAPGETS